MKTTTTARSTFLMDEFRRSNVANISPAQEELDTTSDLIPTNHNNLSVTSFRNIENVVGRNSLNHLSNQIHRTINGIQTDDYSGRSIRSMKSLPSFGESFRSKRLGMFQSSSATTTTTNNNSNQEKEEKEEEEIKMESKRIGKRDKEIDISNEIKDQDDSHRKTTSRLISSSISSLPIPPSKNNNKNVDTEKASCLLDGENRESQSILLSVEKKNQEIKKTSSESEKCVGFIPLKDDDSDPSSNIRKQQNENNEKDEATLSSVDIRRQIRNKWKRLMKYKEITRGGISTTVDCGQDVSGRSAVFTRRRTLSDDHLEVSRDQTTNSGKSLLETTKAPSSLLDEKKEQGEQTFESNENREKKHHHDFNRSKSHSDNNGGRRRHRKKIRKRCYSSDDIFGAELPPCPAEAETFFLGIEQESKEENDNFIEGLVFFAPSQERSIREYAGRSA